MFHFASSIFNRPTPRHAAQPAEIPACGAKFPPLKRGFMSQRPDFTDGSGLRGLAATDGFTVVMKAVEESDRTEILPVAIDAPPSQQAHDDALWHPQVSADPVPVTTMRRSRRDRQVLTDLPPRTATAEDSYESLAAYSGQRRLNTAGPLFYPRPDDTPYAQSFQAFLDRYGVIRNSMPPKKAGVVGVSALDTAIFATVACDEFSNDTEGSVR